MLNNRNDLISVIIPAYNAEQYIRKTIESICNQSYKNLEIIVVDDGSTDETKAVIEELLKEDDRVYAYFKSNGGVTSARLYGLEKATGDWVAFVDSDDTLSENMYERLMDNAVKYDADISHCGYKMIFPDRVDLYYDTRRVVVQTSEEGIRDLIEGKFIEPALWNKLFRKELFNGIMEKMDFSIKNWEDLLMNFYVFQNSKRLVYFDECLYNYTIRANSASTGAVSVKKLSDPLTVLKIVKTETSNNKQLQSVIDVRMIGRMLQVLKLHRRNCTSEIFAYTKLIRKELKKLLKDMKPKLRSKKLRMQCFLAINLPFLFRFLQLMYAKATGSDKKYKI